MARRQTTAAPAREVQVTSPDEAPAQDALAQAAEPLVRAALGLFRAALRAELDTLRAELAATPATRRDAHEHYTKREAAQALRCSEREVNRKIARGLLAATKLSAGGSSRVLIARSAVERLLAGHT